MKKKQITRLFVILFCLLLVPNISENATRDYPHNTAETLECLSCHYVTGTALPSWASHTPLDIDDSRFNNLCWGCHTGSGGDPALVYTHSSLQTDASHGDWSMECKTCHDPHRQKQTATYGAASYLETGTSTGKTDTTLTDSTKSWTADEFAGMILIPDTALAYPNSLLYQISGNTADAITIDGLMPASLTAGKVYSVVKGKLIKNVINAPDRATCSVVANEYVCTTATAKTTRFFSSTGSNSFADGDATYDGVCEICHTQTIHFQNNGGGSDQLHSSVGGASGVNCTINCHKHLSGFKPQCDQCHQYPPPTNAHPLHVTTLSYDCDECHDSNDHNPTSIATTPAQFYNDYNRSLVDVAFDSAGFNSDANNGTVLGLPAFTPNASSDLGSCANLTCHNPDNAFTGKGTDSSTNNIPVWGSTITSCTDCHTTDGSYDGGSHAQHNSVNPSYGYSLECNECHYGVNIDTPETSGTDSHHADKTLNIDQAGDYPVKVYANLPQKSGITALYTDGAPGTTAGNTCASVYCHGSSELKSDTGYNATLIWGSSVVSGCMGCHRNFVGLESSNNKSHIVHIDTDWSGWNILYGPQLGESGCGCHDGSGSGPNHANGRSNMSSSIDGTLANTDYCDNCHGSPAGIAEAKANWELNINGDRHRISDCRYCHNSATPATAGSGGGAAAPAKDAFISTGHGNTGTYNATGNSGPGFDCSICHDPDTRHITNALLDDDRIRTVPDDGLDYTDHATETCLDCHEPGQTVNGTLGLDASAEASIHSGAVMDNYNTAAASGAYPFYGDKNGYASYPGYQCRSCHDPHGTSKLAMLLETIDGQGGASSNPVTITGFESTDLDMTDLDPSSAANDGVCDVCHTAAATSHPDTLNPGNHNQGNSGDSCMVCHSHEYSFASLGQHIKVYDTVLPAEDHIVQFGNVVETTLQDRTVTVKNNGAGNLTIGSIAVSDPLAEPFSILNNTCSAQVLSPSATCTFDVRFAPSSVGVYNDTFDIPSDDTSNNPVTVSVSGTGTASGPDITVIDSLSPADDLTMPFATTVEGMTDDQTVTLRNDGTQDLILGTIALSNPIALPFSIQNDLCSGQTLTPATTCTFDLRFAPAVNGTYNDTFDIPSNDTDENPSTVTVSGTANKAVYAYVPSLIANSLQKIRLSDNTIVSSTGITQPRSAAVTSDGSYVYVLSPNADRITAVRTSDYVKTIINVGDNPDVLALTPNDAYVYVTNSNTGTVSVVRTSDNTVIDTITVGASPKGIDVSPDGSHVYVANYGDDTVSVIRTIDNTVTATIAVGNAPYGMAVSPDSSRVYAVNHYDNNVSVIRTSDNTVIDSVTVGTQPYGIAVAPDGNHVYVTNFQGKSVSVIRTSDNVVEDTVSMPIDKNYQPTGIAVTPDSAYVYVTEVTWDNVFVIRTATNTIVDSVTVGDSPWSFGRFIASEDPAVQNPDINISDTVAPNNDQGIDFGSIYEAGSSAVYTVSVTNDGDADLILGSIASATPLGPEFVKSNDTCSGQTLSASASCTFDVQFTPPVNGTPTEYYDTLLIPSNDPDESPAALSLLGMSLVGDITIADEVVPQDDQSIPFGSKVVFTTTAWQVTVANDGNGDLVLGVIASADPLTAPFSISNDTCSGQTLAAAASCTLDVSFDPQATGPFSDSFDIPSNDPNPAESPATVNVSGTGTPTAPDIAVYDTVGLTGDLAADFASVAINTTSDRTITVKNEGTQNLILGSIGSGNPPSAPYSLQNDTCSSQTLISGATCTFDIRYSPVAAGFNTDTFNIGSNDPDEATVVFSLSGAGFKVPYAYVPNDSSNGQVKVIRILDDAGNLINSVAGTVAVGDDPFGVSATPNGAYVLVTNSLDNTVSVIITSTNVAFRTINVGTNPRGVVVRPDGAYAYVTSYNDNTISVINTATWTVSDVIAVAGGPRDGIAVTSDSAYIYVSCYQDNTVKVIRTSDNMIVDTITGFSGPYGLAISPNNSRVYVTNYSSSTISVVDTSTGTIIDTVSTALWPYGVVVSPDSARVYVANWNSYSVYVIDAADNSIITTVQVDYQPHGISITPDGQYVFVTSMNSNKVNVLRTSDNTWLSPASVTVGLRPYSLGNFITYK